MKSGRPPQRRAWIKRGTTPLPPVNPERKARRRGKYAAAIRSARFRKLRLARFAHDGWRCTEVIDGQRCGFVDETETGKDLVAEHTGYLRFGHELLEDLRTRCRWCDRRGTPRERVNHTNGFQR